MASYCPNPIVLSSYSSWNRPGRAALRRGCESPPSRTGCQPVRELRFCRRFAASSGRVMPPPVGSCVPRDRDDAPQADVSRRRKINCIGSVIVVFVLLGIAAFGFWRWLEELEAHSGKTGRNAHDAVHAPAAGHSDGTIAPAAPAATETRTNDPFRDFDKSFKGDKRDDKIVGGKAVSEIKVLRDLKVIMEPSVPIAGETFHMVFEFACPSDVVLDSVQLKGLPDSGVVYGEASWLPDVPMNGELSFAVPALKSLSQKGPLDSTVVTKQLPAVVKRLLLPVCAMDSMETSVSASLSAMCNWKIGSHTFGTSVVGRFPPTSIKVVGKTGYVTGHGAASKKVTALCTADMVIEGGRTVELIEPCTDDVRVCSGSTLICRGICSGDVEIMKGGCFVCFGVMSGDILNHGGKVEIYGTFTGTRTDL